MHSMVASTATRRAAPLPAVHSRAAGVRSCRAAAAAAASPPPSSVDSMQSRQVEELAMSLFRSAAITDRGQLKSSKARSQKVVTTIQALEAMVSDSKFEVQGK